MKKILLSFLLIFIFNQHVFADNEILISLSENEVNKKFAKKYKSYTADIINQSNDSLLIIKGNILNGVSSDEAYINTRKNTFIGAFLPWIIGVPMILNSKNYNEKNYVECNNYSKFIPSDIINKNDYSTINFLVPKNQSPKIRIILKNMNTNEIFTVYNYL